MKSSDYVVRAYIASFHDNLPPLPFETEFGVEYFPKLCK
jgi:hypothetical protein